MKGVDMDRTDIVRENLNAMLDIVRKAIEESDEVGPFTLKNECDIVVPEGCTRKEYVPTGWVTFTAQWKRKAK